MSEVGIVGERQWNENGRLPTGDSEVVPWLLLSGRVWWRPPMKDDYYLFVFLFGICSTSGDRSSEGSSTLCAVKAFKLDCG